MEPEERVICRSCPRECGKYRDAHSGDGFCKSGMLPRAARAGLHYWEEPVISGKNGSGTVFFSGCAMKCVYCQNYEISTGQFGREITVERLREIYRELKEKGAHNINLVNPTHFSQAIAESLEEPVGIPVVYNCGGYEKVETLKLFEGKVQIYLTDMKYSSEAAAVKYSKAPGYFGIASAAIEEMYRQTGDYVVDDSGIMQSGVIIRHLVLPENMENTYGVIDYVSERFKPGQVMFSMMGQYIPSGEAYKYPEIARKITPEEYRRAENYLRHSGIEDGFCQELSSAEEEYVPAFDLSGI